MKRYRIDAPTQGTKRTKPKADWTSWGLHLLFGLIVGGMVGSCFFLRLIHYDILGGDCFGALVAGTALMVSGITSSRGEQAWYPRTLFDMPSAPRDQSTLNLSRAVGLVGVVLVLAGVVYDSGDSSPSSRGGTGISDFGGGVLAAYSAYSLWSGCLWTPKGSLQRSEQPLLYWFAMASLLTGVGLLVR